MSWFADLAGKAEDFLNKVDQGAATALAKNQEGSPSSPYEETVASKYNIEGYTTEAAVTQHVHTSSAGALSYISAAAGNIKKSNVTVLVGAANIASIPSDSGSSPTSSAKVSSGFVRPRKEKDLDDDLLFDFLNSSDPLVSSKGDSKREGSSKVAVATSQSKNATPPPSSTPQIIPSVPSTPPSTKGVSRTSSMSSLSSHSFKTESSAKELSQGAIINKTLLCDHLSVHMQLLWEFYMTSIICHYSCLIINEKVYATTFSSVFPEYSVLVFHSCSGHTREFMFWPGGPSRCCETGAFSSPSSSSSSCFSRGATESGLVQSASGKSAAAQ